MFRNAVFFLIFLFAATSQMACYSADLRIVIVPEFNGQPLMLSKQLYKTGNNDSLYIDAFRCYLAHFRLSANDRTYTADSNYHLADASDAGSLDIVLKNVPAGKYDRLMFDIGVDSLSNVSGAMGGDLDPTKGMYWAWNTGFINAKLEGRSSSCHTLHHTFEFHIGGFMAPFNTFRTVSLLLKNCTIPSNNKEIIFNLHIDLSAWFSGIRLMETNSIVMPSGQAVKMADNYTKMFSVVTQKDKNER